MSETLFLYKDMLIKGTIDTLYMSLASTFFAYILGLPLGILLYTTDKDGLLENKIINSILGFVINIGRSIPFVVLLVAITPLTKLIAGKIIGPTAAIVPLVVGAAPFVARLCESSFKELDLGLLEASLCMGATKFQIITKVLIREAIPSLVRGVGLTTITLVGYAAIAEPGDCRRSPVSHCAAASLPNVLLFISQL